MIAGFSIKDTQMTITFFLLGDPKYVLPTTGEAKEQTKMYPRYNVQNSTSASLNVISIRTHKI